MDALLTAIVPILAALGGGIAFVWGKIEKRFTAIEGELKEARKDLDDCKSRDASNKSMISELLFALRMMADEMHASDPTNPLLKSVRQMLAKAYPIPRDMEDQLERIP